MWDVLLDAFLDTLKLSWVLLIFYILIELIEQKIADKMQSKLKSDYAVAVGSAFGIIPQCGFSVLASDLYSRRQITLGALLAVFIATSDEALPILLSQIYEKGVWLKLLMLIFSKLVLALIVGYSVDLLYKSKLKKSASGETPQHSRHADSAHEGSDERSRGHERKNDGDSGEKSDVHKGCCGHHIDDERESKVKKYLVHPLLHTLKILAYILIINAVMGIVVYYVGEDKIAQFMTKSGVFQPIIVTLVGLIPNCASSVIITEMFLSDAISFGSCLGGLIVNAGLGIAFLFKANKNIKQNFAIVGGLFVFAVIVAIAFHYIVPMKF